MRIEDGKAYSYYKGNGSGSGDTFLGEFIFKVTLNPMEVINTDKYYRVLLGENHFTASKQAKDMAFALSQLKYRVFKSPTWWEEIFNPESQFFDYNIIIDILNLSYEAEQTFQKQKEDRLKESKDRIEKVLMNKTEEEEEELIEDEE